MSPKYCCQPTDEGYYTLTQGVKVPVRLFLNEKLFAESEVIDAVVGAGLAEVAHTLTPIASIKGND